MMSTTTSAYQNVTWVTVHLALNYFPSSLLLALILILTYVMHGYNYITYKFILSAI